VASRIVTVIYLEICKLVMRIKCKIANEQLTGLIKTLFRFVVAQYSYSVLLGPHKDALNVRDTILLDGP
jgi:hypothetical protein